MKLYQFPSTRTMHPRVCAGCGERFPKNAPTHWRWCSRCYGYGMFRRAIESFRKVRP